MHCIDPECVYITNSRDADAGRHLIQNMALSQDGTFPVVTVLCFRPIVCISLLSVIVRTCEVKVSDETHKFVMLTISRPNPRLLGLDFVGEGGGEIQIRKDLAKPENS